MVSERTRPLVTDTSRPMAHQHECFCDEVKSYFDFAKMRCVSGGTEVLLRTR